MQSRAAGRDHLVARIMNVTTQNSQFPASTPTPTAVLKTRAPGVPSTPKQHAIRFGLVPYLGRSTFSRWRPNAGTADIIWKHTRTRSPADRLQIWQERRDSLKGADAPTLLSNHPAPLPLGQRLVRWAFEFVGALVLVAFLGLWTIVGEALMEPLPPPEQKCFPTAAQGPACRSQRVWSINGSTTTKQSEAL